MKSTRRHRPCRKCGKEHNNPSSSSICPECGVECAIENKRIKDEIKAMEDEIDKE